MFFGNTNALATPISRQCRDPGVGIENYIDSSSNDIYGKVFGPIFVKFGSFVKSRALISNLQTVLLSNPSIVSYDSRYFPWLLINFSVVRCL